MASDKGPGVAVDGPISRRRWELVVKLESMNGTISKLSILIFAGLLDHPAAAATLPSSEIEFKNQSIHFHAVKTAQKLKFTDQWGPREILIKNCNKKIVETYWKGLVRKVHSLQATGTLKSRVPASGPSVKYEGVQMRVLDYEPSLKFFNRVPATTHVIFWESQRVCKKK